MTESSPTRRTIADSQAADASTGDEGAEPRLGLARGEVVGRYIVVERIGAGGMGVVYAAYDPELDRRVALKIMQPRGAERADAVPRMLREAQALAKLAHPNVVAVHDVGEVRGGIFVAMEFVRGATLTQWAARTQPGWREVVRVLRAAGEGLAAAHDKGLVHRDMKPDNVMIDDEGRVRVMDFGLARPTHTVDAPAIDDSAASDDGPSERPNAAVLDTALTRDGAIVGTPGYMAPEQFSGAGVGPAADQFGFCVMAWEALYGRRPFVGSTLEAVAIAVTEGRMTAPPRDRGVPMWVHRAIRRGLEAAPSDRWSSMRALVAALAEDPRPRRRRGAVLLATTAALAATGITWGWRDRARVAACDEAASEIAEVWNPDVATAVRTAFIESPVADGSAMFDRVAPWIDRYAEQWRAGAHALCMAPADARSEELRARAEDCFAEHKAELDELVRRLSVPDGDRVRASVSSAAGLSPIAACSDPDQLRRVPIVGDEHREEARAVREALARASVARHSGDPGAGLPEAESALAVARSLDFAPLVARGHLEVGTAYVARDDSTAAHAALREAHRLAVVAGADDVAVDAAIALMYVTGYQLERREESGVWEDLAAAGALRLAASEDDLRNIELLTRRAAVRAVSGKMLEARDDFERALALQRARFGETHPAVAATLAELAAAQYQLDDKAGAERSASRALELVAELYGDDHPERGFALVGYSAMLAALGRQPEAESAARDAVAISESALGRDHPALAGALNNLAMMIGPTDEAVALLQRAKSIAERHRGPAHREVAYCANNLGYLAHMRGDDETAVREHGAAAAILEAIPNPDTIALAQTWHNLGASNVRLGRLAEAERAFVRARDAATRGFGEGHAFVGDVLSSLARVQLERSQPADASASLERAFAIHERTEASPATLARDRLMLARARWLGGHDEQVSRAEITARVAELEAAGDDTFVAIGRRWLADPPR